MGTSNVADKVVVITGATAALEKALLSFLRDTERRLS
jgi:NADP-dependent 3-hydroxy acid dehydrogenase YdfG